MHQKNIIIHPHFMTFLISIIFGLFIILIDIILVAQKSFFDHIFWEKIFYTILGIFNFISIAMIYTFLIQSLLHIIIIENTNLITIKQKHFLKKEAITTPIHTIQEIKTQISWVLPTVFWYGKIFIKNASWSQDIIIDYIHQPQSVAEQILKIKEKNT